jgi:hypothetical protein
MIPRVLLVPTLVLLVGCSAKLQRPDVPPARTLDPPLVDGAGTPVAPSPDATPLRLVPVQSRVGRRLLHQRPDGERVEDAVWSWAQTPDRYLDTTLHLAAAADAKVRVVDRADVPALAATILSLHLEPTAAGQRLVASVEVRLTSRDRTVETRIISVEVPVAPELPGDTAAGMARLVWRLAIESLALVPKGLE